MQLSDLSVAEIHRRLSKGGLVLQLGPFLYRIFSRSPVILTGIVKLYPHQVVFDKVDFTDYRLYFSRIWRPGAWGHIQAKIDGSGWMTTPPDMAFALLEWSANCAIHSTESERLVFHGATLADGDDAAIFLGASGDGKSTFSAGAMLSGWRLLSDELAILDTSCWKIASIVRPIILKGHSLELIRTNWPNTEFGPVGFDRSLQVKIGHLKPTLLSMEGVHRPATLRWLATIKWQPDHPWEIKPMSFSEATLEMTRALFNLRRVGENAFLAAQDLAERCRSVRITYRDLSEIPEILEGLKTLAPNAPQQALDDDAVFVAQCSQNS